MAETKTKHTPGPWIVRQFQGRTYVLDAIPDVKGQCVANVIAGPTTNPHWEANARLISAAPDLLAQAEAIIAWALKHDRGHEGSDLLEILSETQAAITKAKGTPP